MGTPSNWSNCRDDYLCVCVSAMLPLTTWQAFAKTIKRCRQLNMLDALSDARRSLSKHGVTLAVSLLTENTKILVVYLCFLKKRTHNPEDSTSVQQWTQISTYKNASVTQAWPPHGCLLRHTASVPSAGLAWLATLQQQRGTPLFTHAVSGRQAEIAAQCGS